MRSSEACHLQGKKITVKQLSGFNSSATSQGGGMADNCSPVGIMPQCWKPAAWLGILTAAGVPAQSWVRTASSSSLQIEGLMRLKAVRLCVCAPRVKLSKSVGGVCRMPLTPWPAWLSGERLQRKWVCSSGVKVGFVFCQGLAEYCTLIDSSSSFRAYRAALADVEPPCIPYL